MLAEPSRSRASALSRALEAWDSEQAPVVAAEPPAAEQAPVVAAEPPAAEQAPAEPPAAEQAPVVAVDASAPVAYCKCGRPAAECGIASPEECAALTAKRDEAQKLWDATR